MDVTISHLGGRGDGIANTEAGPLYIPVVAPGDSVRVRIGTPKGDGRTAEVMELLSPGPDRRDPSCAHASDCGGCQLQHIKDAAIADHKRSLLQDALGRRGFEDVPVEETRTVPPATRRRLRMSVVRPVGRCLLGFNTRASDRVTNVESCPVSRPELVALFEPLRALLKAMDSFGQRGDVQLTLSDTGLDLVFIPSSSSNPNLAERERLTSFAEAHDIARISWESDGFIEPVATRRSPRISVAGIAIDLPIGAFLQPSQEGEHLLADLVLSGIPSGVKAVADLYAGCGSLSLPIAARGGLVHAVEGEAAAIAALRRAAAGLRVTAEVRDLAKKPLSPEELDRYDAVVFDPPRAGAGPQASALARSNVPHVVAVSCNPSTLARDLRTLVDGGYRIQRAVPIDQFTWSAHLEAVVLLSR